MATKTLKELQKEWGDKLAALEGITEQDMINAASNMHINISTVRRYKNGKVHSILVAKSLHEYLLPISKKAIAA